MSWQCGKKVIPTGKRLIRQILPTKPPGTLPEPQRHSDRIRATPSRVSFAWWHPSAIAWCSYGILTKQAYLMQCPLMPVATIEDRSLAKALYLEGLSLKDVAQQINVKLATLCSWKCREKWDECPRKEIDSKSVAIQSVASEFANRTLKTCERILCKVESIKLVDLKDCRDAAQSVSTAYVTARKALGLDDPQTQVHLHLHALGSTRAAQVAESPVIDVSPAIPATQAPEIPQ